MPWYGFPVGEIKLQILKFPRIYQLEMQTTEMPLKVYDKDNNLAFNQAAL